MTSPPSQPTKTLTVAEANALLPQVRQLIEKLQGVQRSIVQANERLQALSLNISAGNGYPIQSLKAEAKELTQRQRKLVEAFEVALRQLEETGCLLKDLTIGLIDFYTLRDGELVFLCWKQGEEKIRFWHTLDDGYPGRQPLE